MWLAINFWKIFARIYHEVAIFSLPIVERNWDKYYISIFQFVYQQWWYWQLMNPPLVHMMPYTITYAEFWWNIFSYCINSKFLIGGQIWTKNFRHRMHKNLQSHIYSIGDNTCSIEKQAKSYSFHASLFFAFGVAQNTLRFRASTWSGLKILKISTYSSSSSCGSSLLAVSFLGLFHCSSSNQYKKSKWTEFVC